MYVRYIGPALSACLYCKIFVIFRVLSVWPGSSRWACRGVANNGYKCLYSLLPETMGSGRRRKICEGEVLAAGNSFWLAVGTVGLLTCLPFESDLCKRDDSLRVEE